MCVFQFKQAPPPKFTEPVEVRAWLNTISPLVSSMVGDEELQEFITRRTYYAGAFLAGTCEVVG